jgi:hypothetical protein
MVSQWSTTIPLGQMIVEFDQVKKKRTDRLIQDVSLVLLQFGVQAINHAVSSGIVLELLLKTSQELAEQEQDIVGVVTGLVRRFRMGRLIRVMRCTFTGFRYRIVGQLIGHVGISGW